MYASFLRICAPCIWIFFLCRLIPTFYEIINLGYIAIIFWTTGNIYNVILVKLQGENGPLGKYYILFKALIREGFSIVIEFSRLPTDPPLVG